MAAGAGVGGSRALRLLLVEDDENDALLIVREFQRAGWELTWRRIETAPELRDAVAAAAWDLVVADWELPSLDAPQTLAILSTVAGDVPCLVVSGAVSEEAGARAMRDGARDYISKANLARLVPAAERELASRDARRQEQLLEVTLAQAERARADAEAATQARDEFLLVLAHELRTPITSVLAYASMLRRPDLAPELQRRALEAIERGATKQARLVEDILDVGRIAAGSLHLRRAPTDLARLVADCVTLVEPLAEAAGVKIDLVTEPVRVIDIDGLRIEQVVWNLLVNALKFTPAGGEIRVRVDEAADGVHLEVSDTGQGIPPQMLAHIFEPHRQVAPGRGQGLGLGLALVRHLVSLHGGYVSARSDGPGTGATFTVVLARAAVPDGDGATPANAPWRSLRG